MDDDKYEVTKIVSVGVSWNILAWRILHSMCGVWGLWIGIHGTEHTIPLRVLLFLLGAVNIYIVIDNNPPVFTIERHENND
jgi:hypothetical protein